MYTIFDVYCINCMQRHKVNVLDYSPPKAMTFSVWDIKDDGRLGIPFDLCSNVGQTQIKLDKKPFFPIPLVEQFLYVRYCRCLHQEKGRVEEIKKRQGTLTVDGSKLQQLKPRPKKPKKKFRLRNPGRKKK